MAKKALENDIASKRKVKAVNLHVSSFHQSSQLVLRETGYSTFRSEDEDIVEEKDETLFRSARGRGNLLQRTTPQ